MRPNEIFTILYGDKVFGRNVFQAVLLQELLINVSVFMSTFPVSGGKQRISDRDRRLFTIFILATVQWHSKTTAWVGSYIWPRIIILLSILCVVGFFKRWNSVWNIWKRTLKIQWYWEFVFLWHSSLHGLTQSDIAYAVAQWYQTIALLRSNYRSAADVHTGCWCGATVRSTFVRSDTSWSACSRSAFQKRQMDGALCRVPADFFEHVWSILERTPGGITLCDVCLPQVSLTQYVCENTGKKCVADWFSNRPYRIWLITNWISPWKSKTCSAVYLILRIAVS